MHGISVSCNYLNKVQFSLMPTALMENDSTAVEPIHRLFCITGNPLS